MATEARMIDPAQVSRWQMMGAEPVYERGTVRLAQYRKNFSPDVVVKIRDRKTGELSPYLLRSGRPLRAVEALPERADLCLDEDGVLVDQAEFSERWRVYLESFHVESIDSMAHEPVPNVARFINAKMDEWGESKGVVEIDFDPHVNGEFEPKHLFDGDREIPVEEFRKSVAKQDKLEELLLKLGDRVVGDDSAAPENVISVEEQQAASEPADREAAPCGKYVKKGYVAQHVNHCKSPACGGDEDEAA